MSDTETNTIHTHTTTRHRTPLTLIGRHVDGRGVVTMYDAVRGHQHPARIIERAECQVRPQDVAAGAREVTP